MTLLKWKLLATPQLGGASSYFSNITHPGIHVKSWRGSPKNEKVVTHENSGVTNSNNDSRITVEEELGTSVDNTPSSTTTHSPTVISSSTSYTDHRRGIHSRLNTTNTNTSNSSTIDPNPAGMNDISGLLLDTNNNNDNVMLTNALPSDTVPHPTMVGNNVTAASRLLKMGWLPGMRQPIAARDVGLASLVDDKVD